MRELLKKTEENAAGASGAIAPTPIAESRPPIKDNNVKRSIPGWYS